MKQLTIQAWGLKRAKIEAYRQGVTVVKNLTWWWTRNGRPTGTKLKQLVVDFFDRNDYFEVASAGVIIAITKGVKNKNKHPYVFKNHKRVGRCKLSRNVKIFLKDTHEEIGSATLKKDAKALARDLVRKYQKDVYAKTVYTAPEDEWDFEYTYKPSSTAQMGTYVVFGIEQIDVRRYRKSKAEV